MDQLQRTQAALKTFSESSQQKISQFMQDLTRIEEEKTANERELVIERRQRAEVEGKLKTLQDTMETLAVKHKEELHTKDVYLRQVPLKYSLNTPRL